MSSSLASTHFSAGRNWLLGPKLASATLHAAQPPAAARAALRPRPAGNSRSPADTRHRASRAAGILLHLFRSSAVAHRQRTTAPRAGRRGDRETHALSA